MTGLHIDLIDRLREASSALSDALSVISDYYGSGDEMFDRVVAARDTAESAADRLEATADTYSEMTHHGV